TLTVDLSQIAQDPDRTTGELAGFGTIGPAQLQQMLCDADLTPILTAGQHTVLDVGRSHRLATPTQRKAVVNRQGGTCAGPGCRGPVVHVHHVQYWSDGGPTDLANLIGLCPRCHAAVHQGIFTIDPHTHQTHRTLRTRRTSRRARAG
uniref:HNH endonuclease n=2 Tax=Aeromicrobium sp. TaxID=1871063 RepID=UPI003513FA08